MNKQILIVASGISFDGGIGHSLYNVLKRLAATHLFDIDLLLIEPDLIDSLKEELPEINVLPCIDFNKTTIRFPDLILSLNNKASFELLYSRILYKFEYRLPLMRITALTVEPQPKKYDIAISYNVIPSVLADYVAFQVNADYKIAWLHGDIDQTNHRKIPGYSAMKIRDLAKYRSVLEHFDKLITVSNGVKESLIKQFPEVSTRSETIYNFTNAKRIRQMASSEDLTYEDGLIHLLTVGTCSYEKGIDIAIKVAKILKDSNVCFLWHFAGYIGNLPFKVKKYINQYDLEKNIVFEGPVGNPFPLYKACDIYVHLSRAEGFCTAINEARMIGKPIISTKVAGVQEQIVCGQNGEIVSRDPNEIAQIIIRLISSPSTRKKYAEYNLHIEYEAINEKSESRIISLLTDDIT